MKISTVNSVFFSPTNTTKIITNTIAREIAEIPGLVNDSNLTLAKNRFEFIGNITEDLLILAAPVYAGRVPETFVNSLKSLSGKAQPAVLIAVYGNRHYDDALIELFDIAVSSGFRPIAAGAFIGEHSYSTNEQPIAKNRPDNSDLKKAREFGAKIKKIITALEDIDSLKQLKIPGNRPYRDGMQKNDSAPETKYELCTKCGICERFCPTEAIYIDDTVNTTALDCIMCCACLKNCPENARVFNSQRVTQARNKLYTKCSERKEPEVFFA